MSVSFPGLRPPLSARLARYLPGAASALPGDRTAQARGMIGFLLVALIAVFLTSLTAGATDASALKVLAALLGMQTDLSLHERIVILDIRLPRAVLGVLIGAALAVSGAVMQGLFRNPLADPGIVGVSAGASLGAVAVIVLGERLAPLYMTSFGIYALPVAAFFASLATVALLYRVATRAGRTSVATMLLAGIALAALAMALTGVMIFVADDQQLRTLTFWGLGSLAGATWSKIAAAGPIILLAFAAVPFLARGLDSLALGEATAGHLGLRLQLFKRVAILSVAAATGAAVAVSGGIGFVGIVVPHLLRLAIGPGHRYLLPASALLGAILLILADAVSRTIVAPAELPIGIVTAIAGAPFFLWVLLRRRGLVDL